MLTADSGYPKKAEDDDFLNVTKMRGPLGCLFLMISSVLAVCMPLGSLASYCHREWPGTIICGFAGLVSIIVAFGSLKFITTGQYYYLYVGAGRIEWGDSEEHTAIELAKVSSVTIEYLEDVSVIVEMSDGESYEIDSPAVGKTKKMREKLEKEGIRVVLKK